jgi:hypothetical protein
MPGLRAGVHDQEWPATSLQLPSDRQAGLVGADDEHIENRVLGLCEFAAVGRLGGLLGGVDVCHEC